MMRCPLSLVLVLVTICTGTTTGFLLLVPSPSSLTPSTCGSTSSWGRNPLWWVNVHPPKNNRHQQQLHFSIVRPNPNPKIIFRTTSRTSRRRVSFVSLAAGAGAPSSRLSESDKERLLMGEAGMTAFIVAEMRHFVNETMFELDRGLRYGIRWTMPLDDKIRMGLADEHGTIVDDEYAQYYTTMATTTNTNGTLNDDSAPTATSTSPSTRKNMMDGSTAVDLICNATQIAFQDGFRQQGILSALGSAILFFRDYYRTPTMIAACERIGLSDYAVAHHITDMYHHRTFRGAYTKTLTPSGRGEIAAALAVGIMTTAATTTNDPNKNKAGSRKSDPPLLGDQTNDNSNLQKQQPEEEEDDDDECLLWSPTTPGVCLHWKSEDDAWRKTRFERIQMEGTRDPRRGGSGTSR